MVVADQKYTHIVIIVLFYLLTACSSVPVPRLEKSAEEPSVSIPKNHQSLGLIGTYSDPFEGINRRMYYFNAKADHYVLWPMIKGYKQITPDFIEAGVRNFFNNLSEISTFINSLLQFKLAVAGETLGRFALNTTVGVVGLFDVATPSGLVQQNEDFGQTLGYWGVDAGPYLILPILGPSSLRDTTGLVFDNIAYQQAIDELGMTVDQELFLTFLQSIDKRAALPLTYYASGSVFEYEMLRILYLKYREIQIAR